MTGESQSRIIRHYEELEVINVIEKTDTNITILISTHNTGGIYTDQWETWVKWEAITDDPRSKKMAFRQVGKIFWQKKPWVTWRVIEKEAVNAMMLWNISYKDYMLNSSKLYKERLDEIEAGNSVTCDLAEIPPAVIT